MNTINDQKINFGNVNFIILFIGLVAIVGCAIGLFGAWNLQPVIVLGLVISPLILVIVSILIIARPEWGPYLIIISTLVLSALPRGIIPFLRPNEALLILVIVIYFIKSLIDSHGQKLYFLITWSKPDTFFFIFFIGTSWIPLILYSLTHNFVFGLSDFFILISPIQYYLIFRIFASNLKTEKQILRAIMVIVMGGALLALISIMQTLNLFGVRSFLDKYYVVVNIVNGVVFRDNSYEATHRAFSLLGDVHATGGYLVCATILAIIFGKRKISPLLSKNLSIVLNSIGIALTVSFVSIIAFFVSVFIIFRIKILKIGLIIFLIGTILLMVPNFRDLVLNRLGKQFNNPAALQASNYLPFHIEGSFIPSSLIFRFYVWEDVIFPTLKENLLFGVSPLAEVKNETSWVTTESYYILLLFKGGVVALSAYLIFIYVSIRYFWKIYRDVLKTSKLAQNLAYASILVMVVIIVMNITTRAMEISGLAEMPWIMFGLTVASLRSDSLIHRSN